MAIKPVTAVRPGSLAARVTKVVAPKLVKDPFGVPRAVAPKAPATPIGYTGSGWNYPTSAGVPKLNSLPTPTAPPPTIIPGQSPASGVPGNPNRQTANVAANFGNYYNDIQSDPEYLSALAGDTAASQQALLARRAVASNIQANSGYDLRSALLANPTLSQYADDISPEALAQGAANPLSAKAQNEQAYNRSMSNLAYEQAGRGTLASGATATGATGLLEQSQLSQHQQQMSDLSSYQSAISDYVDKIAQSHQNVQNTMSAVANRLAQQQYGGAYDIGDTTPAQEEASPDVTVPGTNIQSAATPPPGVVNWGGQQFQTQKALAAWLAARGQSYTQWARQHTLAAKQLR